MRKENAIIAGNGKPTVRITRARAAAYRSTGEVIPLKASDTKQDQKRLLRGNSKRGALDDNGHTGLVTAHFQHKRRAVLKDVTNICCENSYRNCINAAKVQTKNFKTTRSGTCKDSKVSLAVAVEVEQVHEDAKTKTTNEMQKMKISDSQEITFSMKVEENALTQQSEAISRDGGDNNISFGAADSLLEKLNTGMPSQLMNLSKAEGSCFEDLTNSDGLDFVDIDSDLKNPQMCSLYAPDIYINLRVAELLRRPCSNFMEVLQRDITQSMRGILVDWLVEVSEEYKLVPDTLYLTVYIIDRFLSQTKIERQKLQLLGITCMLVASKYEEICAPRVEEFCFITDNTYTKGEVLKMESDVLNYMGFQLSSPTTKTFLRRFLRAAQASYKVPQFDLEFLASYLAELTLVDYGFLKFLPSVIAASAVFLARWTLDQSKHPWTSTLEHYTTYKSSDLKSTVLAMQDLQMNCKGCPLNAIREKYRQQKFKRVAALSSPKLLQTLF